jgi:guanylate kinase
MSFAFAGSTKERLVGRSTDGSSEIKKRMSYARKDISKLGRYDYAVVNDDFSEAVAKLKSIIVSERLKVR